MKRISIIALLSLAVFIPLLMGTASPMMMTDARQKRTVIMIEDKPNLKIHEGYVSQRDEILLVKQRNRTVARIHLREPVMVAMADQEEKWGYFQFPSIGMAEDGTLVVSWQMKEDSHTTYGVQSTRQYAPMMSKDNGRTWHPQDRIYERQTMGYNITLKNGSRLSVLTPRSQDIRTFKDFPKAIAKTEMYNYYLVDSLPDKLQGVYFNYTKPGQETRVIHSHLIDPGLLRYSQDDCMSVVWWGNIRQLADNSLVAGVYPADYIGDNGELIDGGISFYQSYDEGKNWNILGKIQPPPKKLKKKYKSEEDGWSEPAFEILADSSFICVMRSGMSDPMYESISKDYGHTWSDVVAVAPNGVKPRLLPLKKGVLVLASGRPGIQLRFNLDGTGTRWTEPIDMIPFMNEDGTFTRDVSCGYASILVAGDDSFYLVYSDFTKSNVDGQIRKSIWCRKVTVNTK